MANANAPFGFRVFKGAYNQPYMGAIRAYSVNSSYGTALYLGDAITSAGTQSTIRGYNYQDVSQASSGSAVLGVIVGFDALPTDLTKLYNPVSTQRIVYVNDDPNCLFIIQETSGATPLTTSQGTKNINFTVAAGSTTTGWSGTTLANSSVATTNTLDLKLIGMLQEDDNAIGDSCRWLVRFNNHIMVNQTAGI